MKKTVEILLVTFATYALMELYLALRPADLTDQIQDWFESAHGKFEAFLAAREREEAPSVGDDIDNPAGA